MTSLLEPVLDPWADDVYVASLEPRAGGPGRRLVWAALDLWCAQTGGAMELSRRVDLVVRRRHDGVEELRLDTHDAAAAGLWIDDVRHQLSELTPAQFREQWSIAT